MNTHFLGFYPNVVKSLIKRFDIPATLSIIPAFFDYDYKKSSFLKKVNRLVSVSILIQKKYEFDQKIQGEGKYCITWTVIIRNTCEI